jgi:hypothetical protein
LAAIFVVQLAAVAWVFWPRAAATAGGGPLLGDLTADAVTALTITDDADRSVSLERSGDGWTLAGSDGYPAKAEQVTTLLDKLIDIKADRLVANTPASHNRLQVADENFLRKLELTTADGVRTLYVGSSGGASATHVRAAGKDATYLTSAVASWDLQPVATDWIDIAYFNVATADILTVTLENAGGTLTFVPTGDNEWTMTDLAEGEQASSANISTLMSRIAAINLHTVLGKTEKPEYGLAEPLATVTVKAKTAEGGEKTTTLTMGAKDEARDAYYFKSSDSPYYVLLAAFTGDEFANKRRTDYLAQPEAAATPEAAAPAGATAATPVPEEEASPAAAEPTASASPLPTPAATPTP